MTYYSLRDNYTGEVMEILCFKNEVDGEEVQESTPGATGISGLHSRRTRGDRHSSRVEAKNPALLSNRDGYLLG